MAPTWAVPGLLYIHLTKKFHEEIRISYFLFEITWNDQEFHRSKFIEQSLANS